MTPRRFVNLTVLVAFAFSNLSARWPRSAAVFGSTTELVSVTMEGTGTAGYSRTTSVSRNGRYVAFASTDGRLVSGDTNETWISSCVT